MYPLALCVTAGSLSSALLLASCKHRYLVCHLRYKNFEHNGQIMVYVVPFRNIYSMLFSRDVDTLSNISSGPNYVPAMIQVIQTVYTSCRFSTDSVLEIRHR